MLRDFTIFNPGVSRNESKILPYMANICGGSPHKMEGVFDVMYMNHPDNLLTYWDE